MDTARSASLRGAPRALRARSAPEDRVARASRFRFAATRRRAAAPVLMHAMDEPNAPPSGEPHAPPPLDPPPADPGALPPAPAPEASRGITVDELLHQITPHVWVTPALCGLIVLGFVVEIALGASPTKPTGVELLKAGAEFGPEFAEGGIGAYDGGFIHVDVRGYRSRWARIRGQYVGIQHLIDEPVLAGPARATKSA